MRDEDGNVIDIIIDGEEVEEEAERKALNEDEKVPEKIVAKTQVVRGEFLGLGWGEIWTGSCSVERGI